MQRLLHIFNFYEYFTEINKNELNQTIIAAISYSSNLNLLLVFNEIICKQRHKITIYTLYVNWINSSLLSISNYII